MKNLSKKERKELSLICVSLILFAIIFVVDKIVHLQFVFDSKFGWLFPFLLYFAVYLIIGHKILAKAARNLISGQPFDENFLMCVATVGAFALAIYRGMSGLEAEGFDEACAVLLFYSVGEFFQKYATGKSRKSIAALMDIRPDYANVIRDGEVLRVDPSEVLIGETILVNPGEKIALDGTVVKGCSALDTKALTGETVPSEVNIGSAVLSGCVNLTSQLEISVSKEFYDSTVSKILELVESASEKKSKAENFITKFARYYTPAVVIIALLLAVVPGIITKDFSTWIYRALSFLVVSCPCALVISIPLSFFAGIGASSKYGILIKGSDYLEKLNKANVFVFDKTGTLTKGNFAVVKVTPEKNREEILRLACIAERNSNHPIALSILNYYGKEKTLGGDYSLENVAGSGIIATKGDDIILAGNEKLMRSHGIEYIAENGVGSVVYVAHNGKFVGSLLIADEIKEQTPKAIEWLGGHGCKTMMLTGDNPAVAAEVAKKVGVSEYKASLLPQDKVDEVERLLQTKQPSDVLCFVGDGINDAPVLMRADIGIAMGGVGSDAAIESADIVLMNDGLESIPLAKRIAAKTMKVVRQNIIFSLGVKAVILLLSALGITNMWFAVFGDVGVAIIAILNAISVNSDY